MLILFGYVVFFSSAAPLTPLIAFAIVYMKVVVSLKIETNRLLQINQLQEGQHDFGVERNRNL
jgi:hypothetical protein